MSRPRRLAIVGGGITGLAAARAAEAELARRGVAAEITLLEASPRLGGKIATETVDGMVIEQGPDSFLARKPWAGQLIRELGLDGDLVGINQQLQGTYIARGSRLIRMPAGTMMVAPVEWGPLFTTPLFSPAGKLRALLDLVLPRGPAGDEPLGGLIRRRLGREVADWLAAPLLAGVYSGHADKLSVLATFPQLKEMEQQFGSLIRGLRAAKQAARGQGAGGPMFLTLRRGLESMIPPLAASLKATRVATGQAVTGVEAAGGGTYRLRLRDGSALEAEAVIWTTPAYTTAAALEPVAAEAAARLASIPYVSVAVVAMAFPFQAAGRPLDATGFLVPYGQGRSITACTWVSCKWPHASPDRLLVRAFAGRDGEQRATDLSDPELARAVRHDLRELMGITAPPELTRIYRWSRSSPQYRVGHLELVAAIEQSLGTVPGHFVAGAAYRGVGLPDCIRQGQEAAGRAVEFLALRA